MSWARALVGVGLTWAGVAAATPESALVPGAELEPAEASPDAGGDAATESFLDPADPSEAFTVEGEGQAAGVQLSGFADFTFATLVGNGDSSWPDAYLQAPSFYIGNLNVYLDAELSERIRSLVEVRFMYLPQGQLQSDGEPIVLEDLGRGRPGALSYTNTSATDYSDFGRQVNWGGIRIERAWVDYSFGNFLSVRAGQWLTPYGIWNVDHGSPTLIGVRRPIIVSQALFPEHQTGLEAHGAAYVGKSSFGYHLTVSNGRGPVSEYLDLDRNKAVGGRLSYHFTGGSELELGGSFFRGRYTERAKELEVRLVGGEPDVNLTSPVTVQFDELTLGADLRWRYHGLLVQAEVLFNDVGFTPGHRPPATTSLEPNGVLADYRTGGAYLLFGCRTPWWGLMPYTTLETHSYNEQDFLERSFMTNFGVNWRLEPNFVIKGEYGTLYIEGRNFSSIRNALVQVAWAF